MTDWLSIFGEFFSAIADVGFIIRIFPNVTLWGFLFALIIIGCLLSAFLAYYRREVSWEHHEDFKARHYKK